MPNPSLPPRASLEYLRKLAKNRLAVLRQTTPHAQLAAALLSVAQEHGFSSWRALKAELQETLGPAAPAEGAGPRTQETR